MQMLKKKVDTKLKYVYLSLLLLNLIVGIGTAAGPKDVTYWYVLVMFNFGSAFICVIGLAHCLRAELTDKQFKEEFR